MFFLIIIAIILYVEYNVYIFLDNFQNIHSLILLFIFLYNFVINLSFKSHNNLLSIIIYVFLFNFFYVTFLELIQEPPNVNPANNNDKYL